MTFPSFSSGEVLRATDMNAVGLWKVGTFTASGSASSLVCDNVFTSDYENYLVVARLNAVSQLNGLFFQYLDTAGSTVTSGYYSSTYGQDFASSGSTGFTTQYTTAAVYCGWLPNSSGGASALGATMSIYGPRLSTIATSVTGQFTGIRSGAAFLGGNVLAQMTNSTAHRGIRFGNDGNTNLSGKVTIYGFNI